MLANPFGNEPKILTQMSLIQSYRCHWDLMGWYLLKITTKGYNLFKYRFNKRKSIESCKKSEMGKNWCI